MSFVVLRKIMTLIFLYNLFYITIIIIINANNDRFVGFFATGTFQRVIGDSFGVSL